MAGLMTCMRDEEEEDTGEREAAERERTQRKKIVKDIGREARGQMHKSLNTQRQKYAESL